MDAMRSSSAHGRAVDEPPRCLKRAGYPKGGISGAVFFWLLFFERSKKSNAPSGAQTRFNHTGRRPFNKPAQIDFNLRALFKLKKAVGNVARALKMLKMEDFFVKFWRRRSHPYGDERRDARR